MNYPILNIDLGDHVLRYVYLESSEGAYHIIRAGKVPITGDIYAVGSLSFLIQNLIMEKGFSPRRIFLAISRSDILIHKVVVPKVVGDELQEVIVGEIEKIPHFTHQEFDFIFRSHEVLGDRINVVFAAISRKLLDVIVQEVKKVDVIFHDIEIVPLNLKQLLPAISVDAPIPISRGTRNEAILTVYERHSYLTICEEGQYKFFYKLLMGSDQFLSGDSEKPNSPASLFISELRRALKSYSLENKKSQIARLWIAWDNELIPGFDQTVARECDIVVEPLKTDRFKRIEVSSDLYRNPVFTLTLTPLILHLNRLKPEFSLRYFLKSLHARRNYIMGGIVALVYFVLLAFGLWQFSSYVDKSIQLFSKKQKNMTVEVKKLQAEYSDYYRKREDYVMVREDLLNQATFIQHLNRVSWAEVLSSIAVELPEDLALTAFAFSESGQAKINGQAFKMETIADLIRGIETSDILSKGAFDFLKEKNIKDEKLFDFGILAYLKSSNLKLSTSLGGNPSKESGHQDTTKGSLHEKK